MQVCLGCIHEAYVSYRGGGGGGQRILGGDLKFLEQKKGGYENCLNKDPRYKRHSSSPSLSRNLCFVVLIKDGGLGEEDAVNSYCNGTNKNRYIKNLMQV